MHLTQQHLQSFNSTKIDVKYGRKYGPQDLKLFINDIKSKELNINLIQMRSGRVFITSGIQYTVPHTLKRVENHFTAIYELIYAVTSLQFAVINFQNVSLLWNDLQPFKTPYKNVFSQSCFILGADKMVYHEKHRVYKPRIIRRDTTSAIVCGEYRSA